MNAFAKTHHLAADSPAFRNYLWVRERVLAMLDRDMDGVAEPSQYWMEEIAGFDYMLDASPLVISKLREHCYHLTGLHSYAYRRHHAHKSQPFVNKLAALRAIDDQDLFIPESPLLGGYGHEIDGQLVNLDTLKFYETLIAMDRGGLLGKLRGPQNGSRPVVLEIGAGWGGFAYQLKTLARQITYVIVDLPPTLLFSATYLATLFPDAKLYVYSEDTIQAALRDLDSYDFVFLPHYFVERYTLPRLDLTINIVSFQEMTAQQVSEYVQWVWHQNCPHLYSHNRAKSPHNPQMTSVADILDTGYELRLVPVLPVPYTVLSLPSHKVVTPPPIKPTENATDLAKLLLLRTIQPSPPPGVKTPPAISPTDYRHFACSRRSELRPLLPLSA